MLALQALCLFDALGDDFLGQLDEFLKDDETYRGMGWKTSLPKAALEFARTLAADTWRRRQRYDDLLNHSVLDWRVERMAPVDRNVLRLGLHELLECPETPFQVVINEAIELARMFGETESPVFVNGVLDGIRRELAALDEQTGSHSEDQQESGDGTI